jgi:hypothetical protein
MTQAIYVGSRRCRLKIKHRLRRNADRVTPQPTPQAPIHRCFTYPFSNGRASGKISMASPKE